MKPLEEEWIKEFKAMNRRIIGKEPKGAIAQMEKAMINQFLKTSGTMDEQKIRDDIADMKERNQTIKVM